MRSTPQLLLIIVIECGNDRSHPANRANAQVPATPVSSAPFGYDVYPYKALVSENQSTLARLRQNACVGFMALDKILCPDARVLLISHEGDEDFPGKIFAR